MNRDKALTIADRIMTRIETDKAVHKDAIADEIQAGDALDEIVDIISHDGEKWVHRDGTPFDTDADVKQAGVGGWTTVVAVRDKYTTGRSYFELLTDGSVMIACDLDDRDTA